MDSGEDPRVEAPADPLRFVNAWLSALVCAFAIWTCIVYFGRGSQTRQVAAQIKLVVPGTTRFVHEHGDACAVGLVLIAAASVVTTLAAGRRRETMYANMACLVTAAGWFSLQTFALCQPLLNLLGF